MNPGPSQGIDTIPRIKDMAIVLRESDCPETSHLVTLLSRDHGKFRGLAKGSRRQSPSSLARFSGGIDPLTCGQVVGTLKPITGLATITEWDLQDPYPHLRRQLSALHIAYYAVDLAHALLPDHQPHPPAFDALGRLLGQLQRPEQQDAALLTYQWRMLETCGYQPRLEIVAHTPEEAYWFDPQAGGVISQAPPPRTTRSRGIHTGPWLVRRQTLELLLALARHQPLPPDNASISLRRANRLLCAYARHVLERQLPTMPLILRALARSDPPDRTVV